MTSLEFAEVARQLGSVIRRAGHVVPTFRSPPKVPGRVRSIMRRPDGSASVAVALRGRAMASIVSDMIEGVIVANQLHGQEAAWLRDQLWESVEAVLVSITPGALVAPATSPLMALEDRSLAA